MSGESRNKLLFKHVREGDKAALDAYITRAFAGDESWRRATYEKCGDGLLHVACRHGHAHLVRWLVDTRGVDLALSNNDGKTPLHEASHCGQTQCAALLIERGAKVDCLKRADWTPLMLACTKPNIDLIKLLIQSGANVKLKNKDGWTCFQIACREGHKDTVELLFDIDPSLAQEHSKNLRTALHTAALHGCLDVTRLLIERGTFSPDPRDSCGSTPLMDALRGGHLAVAELLIMESGSDLHTEDNVGRNTLHLAAHVGCLSSIKYLVEKQSMDINTKSCSSGTTALHIAAKEGQHDIIPHLVALGADLGSKDCRDRTALHQACGGQFTDTVRALVDLGAKDSPDSSGKYARDFAKKAEILAMLPAR